MVQDGPSGAGKGQVALGDPRLVLGQGSAAFCFQRINFLICEELPPVLMFSPTDQN